MNRIENRFCELREKGEKALIPYIMAGDPDIGKTEELVYCIEKAGGDIIEFGIPYSDPLADGPVIEEAGLRSIQKGFKLRDAFDCVKKIRKNSQIPLVFMCYYNTIFGYGAQRFVDACTDADIDGLIVPDLPMEESGELAPLLENTDIALIPLAALTSRDRIPAVTKGARGFVYCVSSMGVTGVRKGFDEHVNEFLSAVKEASPCPACVGFGIGERKDVERFKPYADGVIVGSALVNKIHESCCDFEEISAFIRDLKAGTK